jgi:transposase-like protein
LVPDARRRAAQRGDLQRRRPRSPEEKVAIVQKTYAPGMSVSFVTRRHRFAPNMVFRWRRLYPPETSSRFRLWCR